MKNHTIYKATHSYTQGSKPRKLLPYYVILEDFKAPDSACGVGHRFVGGWTEEWMRDLIFDAMVANKQCSHSKRKPRLRRPTAKETKWFNGDVICPVCESRCSEVDGKIGDHITYPGKKGYESHVVRVMDSLTITGEHWTCDYCSGSGMPCLGTRGRKEIGFAQEWTITDNQTVLIGCQADDGSPCAPQEDRGAYRIQPDRALLFRLGVGHSRIREARTEAKSRRSSI
jgi:hypothetical protein